MSDTILHPVDIATERLRLRRFRPSDAALVQLCASDRRVAWMTERVPHPYPPGLAEAFVARVAADPGGPLAADHDRRRIPGAAPLRGSDDDDGGSTPAGSGRRSAAPRRRR